MIQRYALMIVNTLLLDMVLFHVHVTRYLYISSAVFIEYHTDSHYSCTIVTLFAAYRD